MDIWAMVQQYVDPLAVFISLLGTEIFRRYAPGASTSGKTVNRFLPVLPLFIGVAVTGCMGSWSPAFPCVIKGLVSGAAASYAYRTFKVVILGD